MTEKELWIEYKATKDKGIRDYFIEKYYPFVKHVAGKIAVKGIDYNLEYDDLVGYGTIGLIDAIERFIPEKNVGFLTYANMRVMGAIYDELRKISIMPRSLRADMKKIEIATETIENETGKKSNRGRDC